MKIKKFNYKKSETDISEREVLSLYEDETHIIGMDLTKLTEQERKDLIDVQIDYEERLKLYMKVYRNFLKEKIEYIKED